jgi:CheY-like chemotaxis protein
MAEIISGIGGIRNKTILCIDDQKDILDLLGDYLDTLGYRIITAEDGEEGLKKAMEIQPDLIFLDIMMPKKNGYAVLRELKADARLWDIPVIMLSVQSEMEEMCQLEGAVHFLSKHFRLKEVGELISEILHEKRQEGYAQDI